tara:strand:- start:598 stop:759 length:162 start_codon:yes stop_codon:yes gene_type:complete
MLVGLIGLTVLGLGLLVLEMRRELQEMSQQLASLQRDMVDEFAHRYGDLYGKK